MQIIGFNFEKISVERKKATSKEEIKIQSAMNILEVSEEKVDVMKEQTIVRIVFEFIVQYQPEFALVQFKGSILAALEKAQLKEVLQSWKQKQLAPTIRTPIFNLILNKCNIQALQLEDELGLPFHVQLPKITEEQMKEAQKKNSTSYAG